MTSVDHLTLALNSHASGDFRSARIHYEKVLAEEPNSVVALGYLGTLYAQSGNISEALPLLRQAVELDEFNPNFLVNYANILFESNEYEIALQTFARAVLLRPNPVCLSNMAACHNELKEYRQGLEKSTQAIAASEHLSDAWLNHGNALAGLGLNSEALKSYEKAISLKPDFSKAHSNRAYILRLMGKFLQAEESCNLALQFSPNYAEAWLNLGNTLDDMNRFEEALLCYRKVYALKPKLDFLLGALLHSQLRLADWREFDALLEAVQLKVGAREKACDPFPFLGVCDNPALQKICAETYTQEKFDIGNARILSPRENKERVKIAYYSMDFHDHPVSQLVVELIERHDRSSYEIFGFSFGPDTRSDLRKRLEKAFDKFYDVQDLTVEEIVELSRKIPVDIAVDLGGHTRNSRFAIFQNRVAPIQVNYLGFPGTSGGVNIDYIIGDETVIPPSNFEHYTEKVILMPRCFQANPTWRDENISSARSRVEFGLPEHAFVYCCFNNLWKITPHVFGKWMRILHRVPGSVLWLIAGNSSAERNLKAEASRHGVCPNRLVFADRVGFNDYLARYTLADLFLDTLPYNAGTTARDALWAGLPVLTQMGESFAGRMAASLLKSLGLEKLIAASDQDYESLAVTLATDARTIQAIRDELDESRSSRSLFDSQRFARELECAYAEIHRRWLEGVAPDNIRVVC